MTKGPARKEDDVPRNSHHAKGTHDAFPGSREQPHRRTFEAAAGAIRYPWPNLGYQRRSRCRVLHPFSAQEYNSGPSLHVYDHGGTWRHEVIVEEVCDGVSTVANPVCTDGDFGDRGFAGLALGAGDGGGSVADTEPDGGLDCDGRCGGPAGARSGVVVCDARRDGDAQAGAVSRIPRRRDGRR